MANTTYSTTGGENWGMISYKAYGDETLFKTITDANPTVAITPVLPAGLVLVIPITEQLDNTVPQSSLPPWKQAVSGS